MAELAEPKQRHLRQQGAFAGDRLAEDHVKRTHTVAGHHQQPVFTHGVVIPHFAAREQRQRSQGRSVESLDHGGRAGINVKSPRDLSQVCGL